jgi:hypothetical protein
MKLKIVKLIIDITLYFSIFIVGLISIVLAFLFINFGFNPDERLPLSGDYVLYAIISGIPSIVIFIGLVLRKSWAYLFSILLFSYLFLLMLLTELSYFKFRSDGFESIAFDPGLELPLVLLVFLIMAFLFIPGIKRHFYFVSFKQLYLNFKNIKSFSILLLSISLIVISDIFIIKQYSYNQSFLYPQPHKVNSPEYRKWKFYVEGKISDENIKSLIKTVHKCPDIDNRIFFINVHKNDSVTVETGGMKAALWGSGNKLEIIKRENKWKIVSIGSWIS